MTVTGNISLATAGYYLTEDEWRAKTGISTTDESSTQFDTDRDEARELFRHKCFYLVRKRIIYKRSDDKAHLPQKWIADGNLNGTITTDDLYVYELADDGFSFDAVDASEIDSIDAFNNYITFDEDYSPTNQLFITFYTCSKPYDEISKEIERALSAQVVLLCIGRLRKKWGLKGTTGWTVPGVTVTKDISAYKELYEEAKKEMLKYESFLRPFVGRNAKVGYGSTPYDNSVAYSSQMFPFRRMRRM